ncbi:MAG: superoxide dismutase [Deltaproteobacteria bacterium]|nr:superoxide dismutase [Deltaproteobacteria bacterium]
MAFELPALPYADTALEPHYSQKAFSFHYGKHHRAYVDNLKKLVAGTDLEKKTLEEVIRAAVGNPEKAGIFNNSAQVWNHTFFWNSMKPGGGGQPGGDLLAAIDQAFGGYDKFVEQFKAAAVGRFGSGWAWLVLDGGALKIVTTANAETPITGSQKPLLTVDVWEHAYYLDYQNRRPDFVQTFFDKLVNWDFAAANFKK